MKIPSQYNGIPQPVPLLKSHAVAEHVVTNAAALTPQELLAKTLEEKRALVNATPSVRAAEPELGKLIDLKV